MALCGQHVAQSVRDLSLCSSRRCAIVRAGYAPSTSRAMTFQRCGIGWKR